MLHFPYCEIKKLLQGSNGERLNITLTCKHLLSFVSLKIISFLKVYYKWVDKNLLKSRRKKKVYKNVQTFRASGSFFCQKGWRKERGIKKTIGENSEISGGCRGGGGYLEVTHKCRSQQTYQSHNFGQRLQNSFHFKNINSPFSFTPLPFPLKHLWGGGTSLQNLMHFIFHILIFLPLVDG